MTEALVELLICNAGSSSIKLAEFVSLNADPLILNLNQSEKKLIEQFKQQLALFKPAKFVLHRIVHAGRVSEKPQQLDATCLAQIRHWQALAPLHNGLALRLIELVQTHWPNSQQFAVFDSGLFADLPPVAQCYALPANLSPQWPIRRYGFHGLAHRSQFTHLQSQAKGASSYRRVISLQLGSGCSAAAWLDGKVIDTSMGFTPLDGLSMATRGGSIDPGVLLHLVENLNYSPRQLSQLLNRESGLKGLSAESADLRELLTSDTASAELAIAHYCYQIQKTIGAYWVVLGGLDAICFGGGVGENASVIREKVIHPLSSLRIELDTDRNQQASGVTPLHSTHSQVEVWLTPVDEITEMKRQFVQSFNEISN